MKMFYRLSLLLFVFFLQPVYAVSAPDFTSLVKEQNAIVVNISTKQKKKALHHRSPKFNLDEMPDAFKEWLKRFDEKIPEHQFGSQSLGSGFLISTDGYIMTNYHVVKEADEIIVKLTDRTEKIAQVIGVDKRSDVAVLKIEGEHFPFAKIGTPNELEVGEWVLAIGSPFGFDYSVTAGIVSAKGRSLPKENYVPFIQTDVAINPGNSGGPLFNLKGEVVGVNSQIFSRTGGFMGLSFSIPIDVAMNVVRQIKEKGHVSRGWLGVMIQDVTRELAESFHMDRPHGALVSKVLPNGPAKNADFQVGDIIVNYRGQVVDRSAALPPMVGITPLNSVVDVDVIRAGKIKTLRVEIGELPSEAALQASVRQQQTGAAQNRLGVVASELSAKQKRQLAVDSGVSVQTVKQGPAREAGIASGDVLLMIDGVKIKNLAHFQKMVADLTAGRSVAILLQRVDGPSFIALKVPK